MWSYNPGMELELIQFVGLVCASILLTGIVLAYLRHRAILDHPNGRSSHQTPTPRGGGLAVTLVAVSAMAAHGLSADRMDLTWLAIGALILAVVSWIDDLRSLSARLRLLVQFTAVAVTLPWLIQDGSITGGILPYWVEMPLAAIAWVGFVNFFNFMDGIDGISGVEAASIGIGLYSLGLMGVAVPPVSAGLIIAAAAIGFLVWNWHPARIFLGDVGSVPLGFLLGGLLLQLAAAGFWASAVILPLYYLADAGITLTHRLLRGEKIWEAHREHFYQKAVQGGHRHSGVSTAIALANVILIALAVWALDRPLPALGATGVTVALLIGWMHLSPRLVDQET